MRKATEREKRLCEVACYAADLYRAAGRKHLVSANPFDKWDSYYQQLWLYVIRAISAAKSPAGKKAKP